MKKKKNGDLTFWSVIKSDVLNFRIKTVIPSIPWSELCEALYEEESDDARDMRIAAAFAISWTSALIALVPLSIVCSFINVSTSVALLFEFVFVPIVSPYLILRYIWYKGQRARLADETKEHNNEYEIFDGFDDYVEMSDEELSDLNDAYSRSIDIVKGMHQ